MGSGRGKLNCEQASRKAKEREYGLHCICTSTSLLEVAAWGTRTSAQRKDLSPTASHLDSFFRDNEGAGGGEGTAVRTSYCRRGGGRGGPVLDLGAPYETSPTRL